MGNKTSKRRNGDRQQSAISGDDGESRIYEEIGSDTWSRRSSHVSERSEEFDERSLSNDSAISSVDSQAQDGLDHCDNQHSLEQSNNSESNLYQSGQHQSLGRRPLPSIPSLTDEGLRRTEDEEHFGYTCYRTVKRTDRCNSTKRDGARLNNDLDEDPYTYFGFANWRSSSKGCKSSNVDRALLDVDLEVFVPQMVVAFKPLLEITINVPELLPNLNFISSDDFPENLSPRERVKNLITLIKESQERGKWQTFIQALDNAGFSYIAKLLRGETEADHACERQLLKIFTPQIIDRISADVNGFMDCLLEEGSITDRDKEEVQAELDRRGATSAAFMLTEKLPRKHTNWYDILVNVAGRCGMDDIVKLLDVPVYDPCQTARKTVKISSRTPKPPPLIPKKKKKMSIWQKLRKRKKSREIPTYLTPIYESSEIQSEVDFIPFSTPTSRRDKQQFNKTELEILEERKEKLQKQINERKMKQKLRNEIKQLEEELAFLTADDDLLVHLVEQGKETNSSVNADNFENVNMMCNDETDASNDQLNNKLGQLNNIVTDTATVKHDNRTDNENNDVIDADNIELNDIFFDKDTTTDTLDHVSPTVHEFHGNDNEVLIKGNNVLLDGAVVYYNTNTLDVNNFLQGVDDQSTEDEHGYEQLPDDTSDERNRQLDFLLAKHTQKIISHVTDQMEAIKKHIDQKLTTYAYTGDEKSNYVGVETYPLKLFDIASTPSRHFMLRQSFKRYRRLTSIDSGVADTSNYGLGALGYYADYE